ncbi:ornithine carbamoyltransferase [Blastocladiella emersonii ATCC 22665]|nr:ornithine carbamoyltransferase [Blastocladiella emersonii ATCC 22665]
MASTLLATFTLVRGTATTMHAALRTSAVASQSRLWSTGLPRGPQHLLTIQDLARDDVCGILSTAVKFKRQVKSGVLPDPSLRGKQLAVVFSKRSTRTRVAAETAMNLLGGNAIFLAPGDIQMGVNESVRDTAAVLSGLVDGVFARVNAHADLMALRTHASVPIINALSDDYHPTQAFADVLTMYEAVWAAEHDAPAVGAAVPTEFDPALLQGKKVTWVGDGNNVCHSLLIATSKLGMNMSIATPPGYSPKPSVVTAQIRGPLVTTNPVDALHAADFVHTDCWVSMGQEAEAASRRKAFAGFRVTRDLLHKGGVKHGAKFMHCLPRKADEVDDDVFYGRDSLVFQQAENRKWTIMAILHHALGTGSWTS